MTNDAIWIVDDDSDDHDLVRDIFKELHLPHKVEFFTGADEVIKRMAGEKFAPFIIICDVNLRGMDGFQLREEFLKTPNKKFHSVPFIYWTTSASETQVDKAFKLMAHGFFIKEPEYKVWKELFIDIIKYWTRSRMPSKKDNPDTPLK